MPTNEEIINALSVIQTVCKTHMKYNKCNHKCPFYNENICTINDLAPDNWKLNDPDKTTWKALL